MATATSFTRNALQALQNLGIIKIPDDGLDGLAGFEQTRGYANPSATGAPGPLQAIYDWVWLILSEAFLDDPMAPKPPWRAEGDLGS